MSHSRFWNLVGKKLSGEALPEELDEINELLIAHPEWLYSSEQITKYWKEKENDQEDYDAELAFEIHLAKLKEAGIELPALESPAPVSDFTDQEKKPKNYKKSLVFVVLLFMVSAGVLIWYNNTGKNKVQELPYNNFSEVSTKQSSRSKLVLPDSTVVWLNSGSTLTYSENFGTASRNTKLKGEAFFEVKKSSIPFLIQANGVQIKVLGTAFNVKSYPGETTETSLIRGKIEITLDQRPGEKFILKPNEKLVVSAESKKQQNRSRTEPIVVLSGLTFTPDNTIIETSWMQNKLVFQDASFSDLAKTMERWYGVNIDIQNEKLGAERFTGTFTTETIQEALEGLQISTPFRFTIKSNSIVITR